MAKEEKKARAAQERERKKAETAQEKERKKLQRCAQGSRCFCLLQLSAAPCVKTQHGSQEQEHPGPPATHSRVSQTRKLLPSVQ